VALPAFYGEDWRELLEVRLVNLPDALAVTPDDSPLTPEAVLLDPGMRDLMQPKVSVGESAPFELARLDRPEERVNLVEFAGAQPVALIFGSYT
jgi:hypothetical protein